MNHNTIIDSFRSALEARGIEPQRVIADGNIHRCGTADKPRSKNGSYVLFLDDPASGGFQNWRDDGGWETWTLNDRHQFTGAEKATYRENMERAREKRRAADEARHAEARTDAARIWAESSAVVSHEYLTNKGIGACGVRQKGAKLVIPLRDTTGVIHTVQFISADGSKLFLPDGAVRGHYYGIGKGLNDTLCICEGFATGASVHEATGYPVAVAFDAGNLLPVARALHKKHRKLKLIICADNDTATDGNPGLTKAKGAAAEIDALLAVPEGIGDFNDLHASQGLEAVKAIIESCEPAPLPVTLIRASDCKIKPVTWLFENNLAAGKLHMLAGAPGVGKSSVAISWCATISSGGKWPDGTTAVAADVVVWSGEDDIDDSIVPKLKTAGADMNRVLMISGAMDKDGHRSFDPARDIGKLQQTLERLGIKPALMIIDPIVSAIATDSHKNAEVRRDLQPLVDFGTATGCALLGITHFAKGTKGRAAGERIIGSVAFNALPRVSFVAVRLPDDHESGAGRLIVKVKSNMGLDKDGFYYDMVPTAFKQNGILIPTIKIEWKGEAKGYADDLLAQAEATGTAEEQSDVDEAVEWLQSKLATGPRLRSELIKEGSNDGFKKWTLDRARKKALVRHRRSGEFHAGTEWYIETPESGNLHWSHHSSHPPIPAMDATSGEWGKSTHSSHLPKHATSGGNQRLRGNGQSLGKLADGENPLHSSHSASNATSGGNRPDLDTFSSDITDMIRRSVMLINDEREKNKYTTESFLAEFSESDLANLDSKMIGVVQHRIRFGRS